MDSLWAPWRLEYILSDKDDGCFICEAVASDEDEQNLLVQRGEKCVCILNRFPYSNGHVLVAPRRHRAELTELDEAELLELMTLTRDVQVVLQQAVSPHGFNIGLNLGKSAGAGLPGHLHVHVVPRWEGDTNFMAVVGDTKVIPQALAELYHVLSNGFRQCRGGCQSAEPQS